MARRVGAVISLAMLLACSGSEDAGLSRAEYIAQADQVCQTFMDAGAVLSPPSEVELVEYFDDTISLAEQAEADLAALEPPEDAGPVHDKLLAALAGLMDGARQARASAAAGDMEAVGSAMERASDAASSSDEAARAFGFDVCGSEAQILEERRSIEAAAFCVPFVEIATSGALTPDQLGPLLDRLVAAAPPELSDEVERWAELALGTNLAFAEAGATPDKPVSFDDVRPYLDDDELTYLEETAQAQQTGTLTDGVVGDVLGYAAEFCEMT